MVYKQVFLPWAVEQFFTEGPTAASQLTRCPKAVHASPTEFHLVGDQAHPQFVVIPELKVELLAADADDERGAPRL